MAVSNRSELISHIVALAFRSGDAEFLAVVPDFISAFEGEARRNLSLGNNLVDVTLTGTQGSRELDLPADFVEAISLHLTTDDQHIELRPDFAGDMPWIIGEAWPEAWAIARPKIQLDAQCDQAHTFLFRYRKSFGLTEAEPTNWLLTNYPDCYVKGVMQHASAYMRDGEEEAKWKAKVEQAFAEIQWQESRNQLSTARVDPALAARSSFNITTG